MIRAAWRPVGRAFRRQFRDSVLSFIELSFTAASLPVNIVGRTVQSEGGRIICRFGFRRASVWKRTLLMRAVRAVSPFAGLGLHDPVTLASGVFQLFSVNNFQVAARGGNNAGFLQNSGCHSYTGPAGAKHLPEKFLSQGKVV